MSEDLRRFNRFPPKGIFLPSILDIYSKMKILLEAVRWLKRLQTIRAPSQQLLGALYQQSAWCGWRIHFAVFHHHNSGGGMMANDDGNAAAAARSSSSSSSMHGKPAQKNIVFSNLRLLFPYNNIPLASPAIWFCSKPAIMPVEYYMLWTQPTIRSSEPTNVQMILL